MRRPIHRAALAGLLAAACAAPALAQDTKPRETEGLAMAWSTALKLGPQVPQIEGYTLRVRQLTVAPGGAVGYHRHDSRPTVVHLLSGELVEHRDGMDPITRHAGDFWAEDASVAHWVENRGDEPAVATVSDVVPDEQ
jgi:quercetin dioxygenase-like cupin family protein